MSILWMWRWVVPLNKSRYGRLSRILTYPIHGIPHQSGPPPLMTPLLWLLVLDDVRVMLWQFLQAKHGCGWPLESNSVSNFSMCFWYLDLSSLYPITTTQIESITIILISSFLKLNAQGYSCLFIGLIVGAAKDSQFKTAGRRVTYAG